MLNWYGRLTAGQLAEVFGIQRVNAQAAIRRFRELRPDELRYDRSQKRQVAGVNFTPKFVQEAPQRFLEHLRGQKLVGFYRDAGNWDEVFLEDLDALTKLHLKKDVVSAVVQGVLERKMLRVNYHSLHRLAERMISPHHLFHAEHCYYVRAYCHLSKGYRNFGIGRMLEAEVLPSPSMREIEKHAPEEFASDIGDFEWRDMVNIRFRANPDLPEEAQQALRLDFNLDADDTLSLRCRKALIYYTKRRFSLIDPEFNLPRWIPHSVTPDDDEKGE